MKLSGSILDKADRLIRKEYSLMRHFVLISAFALSTSLFLSAATPLVNNSTINYTSSPNQITINGSGFQPQTNAPAVLFNNVSLTLVSYSNTQVVAKLPTGVQPGSYRLRVTNSQNNYYEFDATYGAFAPNGPIGALTFFSSPNFVMQASSDGNSQFSGLLYGNGSMLTNVNAATFAGLGLNSFALQNSNVNLNYLSVGSRIQLDSVSGNISAYNVTSGSSLIGQNLLVSSNVQANGGVFAGSFHGDGSNISNVNAALLQGHPASDFLLSGSSGPSYFWNASYTVTLQVPGAQTPYNQVIGVFEIPGSAGATLTRIWASSLGTTYLITDPVAGTIGPCSNPGAFLIVPLGHRYQGFWGVNIPDGYDLNSYQGQYEGFPVYDSGVISVPIPAGTVLALELQPGIDGGASCTTQIGQPTGYGTVSPVNFTLRYTIP